ncbi:hypothetical protein PIB30_090054 [Stylosanthes scabra]|uniref:Uncharacterized protein n=1 Tax=Stylosanthes scabra TaxID=79078 RepID=A0ABU6YRV7_9FABA|nr:hypothetical protein [Stylosanthes scabra]
MSLLQKALPLMTLRQRPSFFFFCTVSNTTTPRALSRTRTVSCASASTSHLIQPPPSASEAQTLSSIAKIQSQTLNWVCRIAFCGTKVVSFGYLTSLATILV